MARRSSEYFLGLAFLSVVFIFFTRRPSDVSEQLLPSVNGGGSVVMANFGNEEPNPIRQISVLGERNSGTRWTFE